MPARPGLLVVAVVAVFGIAHACGGDTPPGVVVLPPFTLTPAGGTLTFFNGAVVVTAPPGALADTTTFTVVTSGATAPTLVAGSAITITTDPAVTSFSGVLTIVITYAPGALPSGVLEAELGAYRFTSAWAPVSGSSVDAANNRMTIPLTQPGTYGILGAPVNTVEVSPANPSIPAGGTVTLAATARDVGGTALPNRAIAWSSNPTSIATVSTTGVVTGVAAGTATVTASVTAESRSGQALITVTDTTTPPTGDNEPAGYTLITDRDWSALATCGNASTRINGWDDIESCQATTGLVSDTAAPRSAPSVYEWRYAQGFVAGSSPGTAQRIITSLGFRRLYVSAYVRLSANWQGHASGTNKMFFVWIDAQPVFFLSAEGVGSAGLQPQLRLQGNLPDTRPRLLPNIVPGATIARGVWQRWEIVLECTTPGTANGRARWWINGILVSDYQDINWVAAGRSCVWENVQLRPVWGGTGGTVAAAMDLRMDHIRVSGQP
jgi:hypothetical protein